MPIINFQRVATINRAHILADGGRITLADLPPDIARLKPPAANTAPQLAGTIQGSLRDQMRRLEAEIIFHTLTECSGDRKAAAQRLEIGLSSLYRKLEEFTTLGINGYAS